ncbi:MAG: hypothetical protein ACYCS7_14015, partial [Acidimicrobiales bacterium]
MNRPTKIKRPRWALRLALVAALGLGLMLTASASLAIAGSPAVSASPSTMQLPVDRQDYVTDTPDSPISSQPIDPYNGDSTSIHVAVNSGQELARSFIHVPLSYLPPGTEATGLTVQLHVTSQSDASNTGTYPIYNTNTNTAIIEACALTTELPIRFDPNKPPAYDCQHGSAIGRPDSTY